jgi:CxxC motif-containing protein (DUF1111 family)
MRPGAACADALVGLALLGFTVAACARRPELGEPLDGLTAEQKARFTAGREEFERVFTPETGLGPLFNADSCAECHEDPIVGGTGDEIETHVAAFDEAAGACDPLAERGGPVIQQAVTPALAAALGIESEPIPEAATARAPRTIPDIFGFGLLDAVPDAAILALSDPNDRDGDGISGRPNHFFDGRIGRFGRKGLVPTLREFNAGAFVIEQGITNPEAPTEESIGGGPIPAGVDPAPDPEITAEMLSLANDFVRFSAPPAQQPVRGSAREGQSIFNRIECQKCHVPSLTTGDSPIKALRKRKVYAYTDLLLHNMGPALADICLGDATPSEFRTEPLMGLRLSTRFLHDGRAATLEDAIRLHDGEAARAKAQFEALTAKERERLLEFLRSL